VRLGPERVNPADKMFTTWCSSSLVGTLSASGSACWFTAFALTEVALVRAVGQVEVVSTLLFSRFYLKNTLRPGEIAGLVLVVGDVLLIVAGDRPAEYAGSVTRRGYSGPESDWRGGSARRAGCWQCPAGVASPRLRETANH
jgi:hypothetical protein